MQVNGAFSPPELIQMNTDHDCIIYRNAIYRLYRLIVIAGTAVPPTHHAFRWADISKLVFPGLTEHFRSLLEERLSSPMI